MKKNNFLLRAGKIVICICLCTAALWKGDTMSFFTDKGEKINRFTTGNLTVGLKEPEWDPKKIMMVKIYIRGVPYIKILQLRILQIAVMGKNPVMYG
ncbi:MAG: hypothetical protein ACLR5B_08060 [Blautia sp.]